MRGRLHDRMTHTWWTNTVVRMTHELFGPRHQILINQIQWQVSNIHVWIGAWMGFMGSLDWDEWQEIDQDLQRLFILLDYVYDEDASGPASFFVRSKKWTGLVHGSGCWPGPRLSDHEALCEGNPKYADWVAKAVVFSIHDGAYV